MSDEFVERLRKRIAELPAGTDARSHDARLEALRWINADAVERIREIVMLFPKEWRGDVLIGTAICPDCGEDHSWTYNSRGFYYCSCHDESDSVIDESK